MQAIENTKKIFTVLFFDFHKQKKSGEYFACVKLIINLHAIKTQI